MTYIVRIGELKTYIEYGERSTTVFEAKTKKKLKFLGKNTENLMELKFSEFLNLANILGGKFKKRFLRKDNWFKYGLPTYFKVSDKEISFFEEILKNHEAQKQNQLYCKAIDDFSFYYDDFDNVLKNPEYDGISNRLHWFIYWLKWAKANCKNPVIHFS